MKQKLFFSFILLAFTSAAIGQKLPVIKVYAYSQATLKGAKPGGVVEEGGNEVKQSSTQNINYYFYIEYRAKEKFSVSSLWINGKSYQVKTDTIRQTPVEGNAADASLSSKRKILVPATKNKVLLIIPGTELSNSTKSSSLKKQLLKGELLIIYKWKGKTYYHTVPKIKVLEPVAAV
jgi:hypothetical protein